MRNYEPLFRFWKSRNFKRTETSDPDTWTKYEAWLAEQPAKEIQESSTQLPQQDASAPFFPFDEMLEAMNEEFGEPTDGNGQRLDSTKD